jgi:hypothetical protein
VGVHGRGTEGSAENRVAARYLCAPQLGLSPMSVVDPLSRRGAQRTRTDARWSGPSRAEVAAPGGQTVAERAVIGRGRER